MKKLSIWLMCLFAMLVANTSVKAQEVTITLIPGWTWISCPTTDTVDFATALGNFAPMQGDIIKSQWGASTYLGNRWRGAISQFYAGYGYHYYSNRAESVQVTMGTPLPQVSVTTAEPTDITSTTATCGGSAVSNDGTTILMKGVCWATHPQPTTNDSYSEDGNDPGDFTTTMTELDPETVYYVRAYAVSVKGINYGEELSFTTEGGSSDHAYVDLGLPSGLLWATCNVGAENPEDYGDYFAWGESQPKDYYDWSTYQYCNGDYNQLTKYCNDSDYGYNGFTDNQTTLLPEDDAATANWGSGWRMPTQAEWQELLDNTTVTWTTQNDVYGCLFTATNGNSLFLPAAGYRNGSSLDYAGSLGLYWSSSLLTEFPNFAWGPYFDSDGYGMSFYDRFYGLSVRPVRVGLQSNVPTGAIDGKFTINEDGGQVYFSQGNLQYQASTDMWKFADNQYDYIGSDNSNISSTYSGWIDLFGWGTSGYDHGANAYQSWSTSQSPSDYYAYGSATYNLYDQTGQADWGYNAISNGGNQTNQWRTLTQPEWSYVFNTRTTTSGIRYAKANVNNVNGVILLPDDWSSSTYSLSNTNGGGASFSSNTLTASQWSTLEQAGAVFLPAAGYREGSLVYTIGFYGLYWSASYSNSGSVYSVSFYNSGLSVGNLDRYYGRSVRLVRVAE